MEIIFSKTPNPKQPTFWDVLPNQFFVDNDGFLCQKHCEATYVTIAKPNGKLLCSISPFVKNITIQRILPLVERIQF